MNNPMRKHDYFLVHLLIYMGIVPLVSLRCDQGGSSQHGYQCYSTGGNGRVARRNFSDQNRYGKELVMSHCSAHET